MMCTSPKIHIEVLHCHNCCGYAEDNSSFLGRLRSDGQGPQLYISSTGIILNEREPNLKTTTHNVISDPFQLRIPLLGLWPLSQECSAYTNCSDFSRRAYHHVLSTQLPRENIKDNKVSTPLLRTSESPLLREFPLQSYSADSQSPVSFLSA